MYYKSNDNSQLCMGSLDHVNIGLYDCSTSGINFLWSGSHFQFQDSTLCLSATNAQRPKSDFLLLRTCNLSDPAQAFLLFDHQDVTEYGETFGIGLGLGLEPNYLETVAFNKTK